MAIKIDQNGKEDVKSYKEIEVQVSEKDFEVCDRVEAMDVDAIVEEEQVVSLTKLQDEKILQKQNSLKEQEDLLK